MMNLMFPWMHRRFSSIHRFLSKFPGFRNPEKHSLRFMNVAQFCGALNDNIYKLVLIFFLIQLEGTQHANAILSAIIITVVVYISTKEVWFTRLFYSTWKLGH